MEEKADREREANALLFLPFVFLGFLVSIVFVYFSHFVFLVFEIICIFVYFPILYFLAHLF